MQFVEDKIREEAEVRPGNVVLVDSFLNHQLDIDFLSKVGQSFYQLFRDKDINKILTIESSGIAIATVTAQYFHVPVVVAKKGESVNLDDDVYRSELWSFTHQEMTQAIVEKRFLNPEDRILIIDDFLANGSAIRGLLDIIDEAEAQLEGVGIVIEKGFEGAGKEFRSAGVDLKSLAVISSMTDTAIKFEESAEA